MAGIETAVEAALRYIIKRPRLTRSLDKADARVLMLVAPAGFGKTTLAREWVAERPNVWYRGTTATADVAALAAGLATLVSEVIPDAGSRMVHRMRATGTPEQDVDILAELFAEDLTDWPGDLWLVIDDYQFAMEAPAPERFVDLVLRKSPVQLLLTSRARPAWASARRLLYGEVYELGRNDLAMDHEEAAAVLSHRKGAPAAGLVTLAEGWPAVIGLAALTEAFELPEGSLPDSLHDYFAEELYQAASPEVQHGLCRLALAPSLGDGVAEFLLHDDAPEVIAEGVRLGFLTARSGTLELHPLLRTFLESKNRERTEENEHAVELLGRHLADTSQWDDAFTLLDRQFSSALFVELLESGLRAMLLEARLATLERWLELARARQIDAPIIDLAESEIAFHQGKRRKAEALAVRGSRRLSESHPLLSRAYYMAGMSARMDYFNDRASSHYERALACAQTITDKRDAVWGQLGVALDLNLDNTVELLAQLRDLDDGSALSEVRLAVARFLVAIREGDIKGIREVFEAAEPLLPRLSEPLSVSSFHACHSTLLVLLGRYDDALSVAKTCERYAKDVRMPFVVGYAKRVRAASELGLRHFARCKQVLDWLERDALARSDIFLDLEAKLVRCRLLVSQGMASQGAEILRAPPERFPFEGERGEYLATLGLALACAGETRRAIRFVDEAESISRTVEVRTLAPCVRAIVALETQAALANERAVEAFGAVLEIGNVDSFVVAYRGYPALLSGVARNPGFEASLGQIIDHAHDWPVAKHAGLAATKPQFAASRELSRREEEVLELVSQGLTNREIANTLFISEATAKVHVRHILEKLGVRSRTEAAVFAQGDPDDRD